MLTRALFLSAGWLVVSFLTTLLRGTHVKKGNWLRSTLWLAIVLLCGDAWALLTFGYPLEVAGLTGATFLFGLFWVWRLRDWNALGQTLWTMSLLSSVLYVIYSFGVTAFTPLNALAFVIALGLTFIETAALALALTYAYESLDVCCRIRWHRHFTPRPPIPGYLPKVSLHVPAYNEPPEVVEATLRSLAQIDYPNFEVLLIDNNTPEQETWRPLEKICQDLGPNFRFLHLEKWPGYKSGALNFAMTQTAPDAEIIGIIDADYRVSPAFLTELTPYFVDHQVAFVQTPQDYRDYHGNAYLEACHESYKYFFAVSMPSRNEHNAIIFAGTMGLIRKSVLQEIGGWDEWCITEDAEASLRVLKQGYQTVFINRTYGTGLMPYTFDGLKKQRFRWCFGGIQILKKHWEALMPWSHWTDPENQLTQAQRYYYLVGGLQWFNEPLNLFFTVFLVMGAIIHFSPAGGVIRPLTGPLIVVPTIFLIMGVWRFLWVLRYTLRLSVKDGLRTMANFFSLGWTVTLACIQGLIQPAGVFMRTPKSKSSSNVIRAVQAAQWETVIGVLCVVLAVAVNLFQPQPTTLFLGILLLWQGSLYLSALYYSLASMNDREPRARAQNYGPGIVESRLAKGAFALVAGLIVGLAITLALPPPATPPQYATFQPQDVAVQQLVGLPAPTATPYVPPTAAPIILPTGIIPPTVPVATIPSATLAPSLTPIVTGTAAVSPTAAVTSTPITPVVTITQTPLPTQPPITATTAPSATPMPPTLVPPTAPPATPVPPSSVPPTTVPPTVAPTAPPPPTTAPTTAPTVVATAG